MRPTAGLLAAACVVLALAACKPDNVGYVEIKTVPASTAASVPTLYLDKVKLEPTKKGAAAVLRQRVGTAKLATDGGGAPLFLCDIVVAKNRVTTVTVSILERPPRCQCRNSGAAANRTCLS